MSGKKIEQVRGGVEVRAQQSPRGRPVQHRRLRQPRSSLSGPSCSATTTRRGGRPWASSTGIYAGGSTNIDGALRTGLGPTARPAAAHLRRLSHRRPAHHGRDQRAEDRRQRQAGNKVHARIFVFGVGYDVNGRFLDKLVRENFGQSEYVPPDEDIEAHVSQLYNRIESPVLTGVSWSSLSTTAAARKAGVNRVYPKGSFDLFAGEQLVLVGRYKKAGRGQGRRPAARSATASSSFDFPADLGRKEQRRHAGLRREALGRPPRGRNPRRDRPQRQERRTGQRAGRPIHAARHPHAVHVVHGR